MDSKNFFIRAIVSDVKSSGEIKVTYPSLRNGDSLVSGRCRISNFWAGKKQGQYFMPYEDDEVIVYISNGDLNEGQVIGSLYSKKNSPPDYRNKIDSANHISLHLKSGQTMILDDQNSKGEITFKNKSGFYVSMKDKKISLGGNTSDLLVSLIDLMQSFLDAENLMISTSMGPGSLNKKLSNQIKDTKKKIKKISIN